MVELSNTGAYLVNGSELVFDTPENAARISGECAIGKEEAKKKYQKPLDTYHGIVVVDIPQSFAEVKKDTAQFTISGWSLSDCLNDRLKVTFDDQEVTEMRKINRSDVLMAYQEKYGGYGTNNDECGFDYFVDVNQMKLGEHSILVQLLDEKDKVISEKDLKVNII